MERNGNIGPKYAIRLSDLCEWHILMARCFRCERQVRLTLPMLTFGRHPSTFLTKLEEKLRCTRCGNRANNSISVRRMPRN